MVIKTLALLVVLLGGTFSAANASRSPPAPTCTFVGKVTDVQTRQEAGQGMSEGQTHTYIDVSMFITEGANSGVNEYGASCDIPSGSTQTFQMHDTLLGIYAPSVPSKKDCIIAQSEVLADGNFMGGNWLTVKETLPTERCAGLSQ